MDVLVHSPGLLPSNSSSSRARRAVVVVVEVVFTYPGIGQTMVDAVRTRDVPVVQACTVIFAGTYILLNLIADIIGIVTNPRLLHPR